MIRRIAAAAFALTVVFSVAACSNETTLTDDQARIPGSSDDFKDEDFQDVVDTFTDAGFTEVSTTPMDDLVTGWLSDPGSVEDVEIGGIASFDAGNVFQRDVSVVVRYHSFPEEDASESAAPTAEPSVGPTAEEEALTIENSEDLVALLALGDNCSDANAEFAAKYADRTIVFDGNISAMQLHGDYDTRYDFLIAPGDYSETIIIGPSFQFRDVNPVTDLDLSGSNGSDVIGVGDQLRITARVGAFESNSCLFLLEPISNAFR